MQQPDDFTVYWNELDGSTVPHVMVIAKDLVHTDITLLRREFLNYTDTFTLVR